VTIPDTRLYVGAIAVVSGTYSLFAAAAGTMTTTSPSAIVMLVVGIIVLVHGASLLTPAAHRIGRLSGPAMLLWAGVTLAESGAG
jgi:K+ transporter